MTWKNQKKSRKLLRWVSAISFARAMILQSKSWKAPNASLIFLPLVLLMTAGSVQSVWTFIRMLLKHLVAITCSVRSVSETLEAVLYAICASLELSSRIFLSVDLSLSYRSNAQTKTARKTLNDVTSIDILKDACSLSYHVLTVTRENVASFWDRTCKSTRMTSVSTAR